MKLSSDDLPIRRSPTTEMDCGRDAPMREKILETSRARPKNCAGSLIATRFRYGLRGISAANLPQLDANPLLGFALFAAPSSILERPYLFHHLPDRMRPTDPQSKQINLEAESIRCVFLQQLAAEHLFQR